MISGVGKKRFQHLATKKTTIFVFFLNFMEFFTLFKGRADPLTI